MSSLQAMTATATGQVVTGPCFLAGVNFHDPAANTFLVYDALSATNLVLKAQQVSVGGNVTIMFPQPVAFKTGIYYAVTGAASTATFLLA